MSTSIECFCNNVISMILLNFLLDHVFMQLCKYDKTVKYLTQGGFFAMPVLKTYSLTSNIYFDEQNTSCLGLHISCQWMFSSPC